MKLAELLQEDHRIKVTTDEKEAVKARIEQLLKLTGKHTVLWTSPEQATTFPCDIRVMYDKNDPRYGDDELEGGKLQVALAKAATKRAFKEALGWNVAVELESDDKANGLRYIDLNVGWAGKLAAS